MPVRRFSARKVEEQNELLDAIRMLWEGRLVVAMSAILAGSIAAAYALTATSLYTAVVVVVPAMDHASGIARGGALAQLGDIAGIAGVSLGDGGREQEALAVLRSRDFARGYLEENQMVDALLAASRVEKPDVRDALDYFQRDVLAIDEDRKNGVVSISIEWKDPLVAAQWANGMIARANAHMRARALAEHERNIAFLRQQLPQATAASLQAAIARLIEGELQQVMVARGNREYAFRVIDTAFPPKERSYPRRTLLVAGAIGVGLFVGVLLVAIRRAWQRSALSDVDAGSDTIASADVVARIS